jgi:hypothetical protein
LFRGPPLSSMGDPEGMTELLSRLKPLVGVWDAATVVDGVQIMRGTMEFDWAEDGLFLVQRSQEELLDTAPDIWRQNAPTGAVSMVGADEDAYKVLYSDSRGVYRLYEMKFDGRHWMMFRDSPGFDQRMTAELSDDGLTVTGKWERSEDGKQTWLVDFEMTLTRIR